MRIAELGDARGNRDPEPVRHDVIRDGEQHRRDLERLAGKGELPGRRDRARHDGPQRVMPGAGAVVHAGNGV